MGAKNLDLCPLRCRGDKQGVFYKQACTRNMHGRNETEDDLILYIQAIQKRMSAEERKDFWANILDGYCEYCGEVDPASECQCWNDE